MIYVRDENARPRPLGDSHEDQEVKRTQKKDKFERSDKSIRSEVKYAKGKGWNEIMLAYFTNYSQMPQQKGIFLYKIGRLLMAFGGFFITQETPKTFSSLGKKESWKSIILWDTRDYERLKNYLS